MAEAAPERREKLGAAEAAEERRARAGGHPVAGRPASPGPGLRRRGPPPPPRRSRRRRGAAFPLGPGRERGELGPGRVTHLQVRVADALCEGLTYCLPCEIV